MKVGDLVKAKYWGGQERLYHTGVIVAIDESTSLFSDKYGITETTTSIRVLCDGEVKVFILDEDEIDVINHDHPI